MSKIRKKLVWNRQFKERRSGGGRRQEDNFKLVFIPFEHRNETNCKNIKPEFYGAEEMLVFAGVIQIPIDGEILTMYEIIERRGERDEEKNYAVEQND